MTFPQLRVRTEFSFRTCYGPADVVAERLAEIGCKTAGIVDTKGTWGHVQLDKALRAKDIQPAYGVEVQIKQEDGRKPVCWVLAESVPEFYEFSSYDPGTVEELIDAKGIIRFAGAALTEPDAFDYIDMNPRSMTQCRAAIKLHKRTKKPLVLTSDNDYPSPADKDRFLAWDDSKKMTPQHILCPKEFRKAFWFLDDETYADAVHNTFEVEERLQGLKLTKAPMIHFEGDLDALVEEGKAYRLAAKHISEWTDHYEARLQREMEMIKKKSFESYFLVVSDLVKWAKTKMLVGPARGSSAGSLVCYLLQITEVDPLVHELIFERFIDINRDDLPDIDIDFNDKKRHLVADYLAEKYGVKNVAQIGSINRLKPRSVMAHAGKKLGIPRGAAFAVLNVLIEYSSGDSRYGKGLEDTMNNTKPGQDFQARYPEAHLIGELENHASHTGVHAAGIIVSNEPVTRFCTVRDGVAQVDKKDAEALNLLKIDALGLRTLGVIEDTGCVTSEELYGLSFDDPAVLKVFDDAKFSGVFQFEGAAQRRVSIQVPMENFKRIDHVTALARPGPLGGGAANTYINRNAGREAVEYLHPSMADYLSDTMGVVLYQEQVMRIVRELGKFSWEETSVIRKAMSGRKGKEFFDRRGEMFVEGAASQGIDPSVAKEIWEQICSFGAWGMNKSHTTSYAMISYWCAYMKCYHPLEYAAACLRSAKDDEQAIEILRELTSEGISYEPFDPELSELNWIAKDGKLIGGFTNLVGIGPAKAAKYLEKRSSTGLDEKDFAALAKCKVKHQDLRPAHTKYGDIYAHPELHNIYGRVKEFADLEDFEDAVVICKLVKKERRDENETVLLNRRGYKIEGDHLFLDMLVVDDSVSKPVVMRIKPRLWTSLGEKIADNGIDGQDWFLVRGKWLKQFSMMTVNKIKCLTNPEIFS